jgi:hypothetical protein
MPAASCATCASVCRRGARRITKPVQLVNLGVVDYREALDLQRSFAAGVAAGSTPDTVLWRDLRERLQTWGETDY